MRVLEVLLVVLAVGCIHDRPTDPRKYDAEAFARSGFGAWVHVETVEESYEGELISIDGPTMHVYSQTLHVLWVFDEKKTRSVEVYAIADVDGLKAERVLTSLAMIPHGWFLPITWPIYLGVTAAAINGDLEPLATYPKDTWNELSKWARFPQGLPAGIGLPDLERQRRGPPPVESVPTPAAPADAGVDATEPDAADAAR